MPLFDLRQDEGTLAIPWRRLGCLLSCAIRLIRNSAIAWWDTFYPTVDTDHLDGDLSAKTNSWMRSDSRLTVS